MRLIVSFLMCLSVMACYKPPYQGEKSDHFDGKQFSSIEPQPPKTKGDLWKWRMTRERAEWPTWVDLKQTDKPPVHMNGGELRASFVNHSTVFLQTRGLNILTDPIWSERASPLSFMGPKRVHEPGIKWHDLPKVDIVLISHSHYDHLDIPTVKMLAARDNPLFIVPLGIDNVIKNHVPDANIHVMDWYQSYKVNDDLTVFSEPVQHWSARWWNKRNDTLWSGYVLDLPDGKIYFSGDTGYGTGKVFRETYKRHGKMRFALIAVGAYEPRWFMTSSHVNPHESVKIFNDLYAENAMGIHIGTFQLTDEARELPMQALKQELKDSKINADKFRTLEPGEVWLLKP